MLDLDNDGIREVFVTNGIYRRPNDMDYIQYQASNVSQRLYSSDSARTRSLIDHMPTLKISNFLFVQEDSLQFVNKSESLGLSTASYSNGAAYGDLDNDGDLDLVVNNVNQEAFVYRNNARQQDTKLNFASFILKGDVPNTFAIGSSMVVYSGKRKLYFENNPVRGFLSSVSNRLIVGLADRAKIDSVDVVWSGTERETFSGISANSNNVLKKGEGRTYARAASSTLGWTWKVETVINGDNHDTFSEFRREPLVPYSIAKESAAITSADVDGDGDADLFAGGSKYSPGRILIQDVKGDLTESRQPDLVADSLYEDTDAAFLDFNKDGRMDLYVASGGNDWFDGHQQLEDRLYVNDGKGRFYRNKQALPDVFRNSSCVRPTDFNNDGLVDLFVGVRSMPGQFGVGAKSYFLRNDGKGRFALAGDFDLGMVTDAAWGDHDRDGRADLFVASDWGNVLVLLNDGSGDFSGARKIQFGEGGLWRSLLLADLNGDGDTELLTGNWGENSRLQPTAELPISMIVGDFDNNGFWDPLLMESIADREIPLAPKNMLAKQMPFISKKFNSFRDYSKIRSVTDILSDEQMRTSLSLRVSNVASGWWKLSKKHSEWQPFPPGAQLSTINSMIPLDADLDGRLDIFCVGNSLMNSSLLGPLDAQSNVLLLNRGGKLVAYATATKDNFKTNYRKAIRWSSNRGVKIVAIDANGSLSIGQILIEPRRSD